MTGRHRLMEPEDVTRSSGAWPLTDDEDVHDLLGDPDALARDAGASDPQTIDAAGSPSGPTQ